MLLATRRRPQAPLLVDSKGFFRSRADAELYVRDLVELHRDPSRKDLAWKYGIDSDVLRCALAFRRPAAGRGFSVRVARSEDIRTVEVRNWLRKLVMPFRAVRLGLHR